jgi:NADPH2:quinone reductase
MARKIRAARLTAHGKPLVVEDVSLPEPRDGEVVVELEYAGVNPIDRYVAEGWVAPGGPLPRTLGGEASGRVDGTLVVVSGEGLGAARDGLYAEAAVVPRAAVVEVPHGVSSEVAASIGVAGVTAHNVVTRIGVGPDDRVLVLGAGGGVGLPIVSFATHIGADVRGQIGRESKSDAVRGAGANEVLVCDARSLAAGLGQWRPTVVIDPLGGDFLPAAVELLVEGGRYVVFGTSAGADVSLNWQQVYRKGLRILGYGGGLLSAAERIDSVHYALRAVLDGRMRIPVERTYRLGEVNDAFASLAARDVTGKIVLALA